MTDTPPTTKDNSRRYVIKSAEIEAMEGVAKVHFLNPNGRRINKSLGDATGLSGFGIHLIEVPSGADSTEYHVHYNEDECVYVLHGRAMLTLDDEVIELGAGDFVGLPAGGPAHVFHNPGPDVLRCLVVGERLEHDVADYPHLGKRLYRHSGTWDLVESAHILDAKKAYSAKVGSK